jgi:hypothetical protein
MPVLQHLRAREDQRNSNVAFDVAPSRASHAPSVKSVGITGQIVGSRAHVIIADDVEVLSNALTQVMRDKLGEVVKEFDAVVMPKEVVENVDRESLGLRVINRAVIPVLRSRLITFTGENFRPNTKLYAFFDIPQIHQVYIFYRAELEKPTFGPTSESSEVALFDAADIPWDELAFPMVEATLDHYLEDREIGEFAVIREDIRRPWKSRHNPS